MSISNPFGLLLLAILPVTIIFLMWREQVRQKALRRVGNDDLVKQLVSQVNITRRRIKTILWMLAFSALVVALTHPVWGVAYENIEVEGRAVMFVIDVSRSMDALDILPSRLDRAKLDIIRITEQLRGDDIGYIVFAGEAFVYMPFTYDEHSINTFAASISSRATSNQGTDIYPAINLAVELLSSYSVAEKHIIVMSDGENHVFSNPFAFDLAKADEILIHTIGYGTSEGSPIPLKDENDNDAGYQTDERNVIVNTVLDPTILQEMALQTGGNYFTPDDIDAVVDILNASAVGTLEQRTITRPEQRFGIFLLLAVIALGIEILLPSTGRTTT